MIYLKGVLLGLGTVLLGIPIASVIWAIWKSQRGAAISYSPTGLAQHLAHSWGFWILIVLLFSAGFVPFVFRGKGRAIDSRASADLQ